MISIALINLSDIVRSPGGEIGIRTPGTFQFNGFQDRRNRPLCHLSGRKDNTEFLFTKI